MSGIKLSLILGLLFVFPVKADYFAGIDCDSPSPNLVDMHFGYWEKGVRGRIWWDGAHPRGTFDMKSIEGSFDDKKGELSFKTNRDVDGSLKYNVAKKTGELKFSSMTLKISCKPIIKRAPEVLCVETSGKKSELVAQRDGVKKTRVSSKDLGNGKSLDAVLDANYVNYYQSDHLRSKRLQIIKMPGQGRFVYSNPQDKSDVTNGYLQLEALSKDIRKFRCFIDG